MFPFVSPMLDKVSFQFIASISTVIIHVITPATVRKQTALTNTRALNLLPWTNNIMMKLPYPPRPNKVYKPFLKLNGLAF